MRAPALCAHRSHQDHWRASERSADPALIRPKLFDDSPVVVLHYHASPPPGLSPDGGPRTSGLAAGLPDAPTSEGSPAVSLNRAAGRAISGHVLDSRLRSRI